VTIIGTGAFEKNQLTSLTIPSSVGVVGSGAFAYSYTTRCCSSDGKQVIDREFNKITKVTIGADVRFANGGFYGGFERTYYNSRLNAGTYTYRTIYGWEKTAVTEEEKKEESSSWHWSPYGGIGIPIMMKLIDSLYSPVGFQFFGGFEFFKPGFSFIRIGLNLEAGFLGVDEKAMKKVDSRADSITMTGFAKGGAFMRLYPVSFMYLSGGANFGFYGDYIGKSKATGEDIVKRPGTATVVFPVGAGLLLGPLSKDIGLLLEAYYNILTFKNGAEGYWSFNIGGKFGRKRMGN
jgi:hypothetical protein